MIALDDYQKVVRQLQTLEREKAQIDGELKQVLSSIKEEFGCETIEEARTLLAEMQTKELKLGRKYTSLFQEFKEQCGNLLTTEN